MSDYDYRHVLPIEESEESGEDDRDCNDPEIHLPLIKYLYANVESNTE